MILAIAGAGVSFAPMAVFFLEHGKPLFEPRSFSLLPVLYAFFSYATGFSLGPSVAELHGATAIDVLRAQWITLAAVAVWVAIIGGLGLMALRRCERSSRAFIAAGLLMPILGTLAFSALPSFSFNVRYTLPAFFYFCVLLALGLEALRTRSTALATIGACAVIATSALSLAGEHTDERYAKEDVRDAVAWWRDHGGGDLLLSYQSYDTVARYLRPDERDLHGALAHDEGECFERLDRWLARTRSPVWVLLARDFGAEREQALRARDRIDREKKFPGVVLLHVLPAG